MVIRGANNFVADIAVPGSSHDGVVERVTGARDSAHFISDRSGLRHLPPLFAEGLFSVGNFLWTAGELTLAPSSQPRVRVHRPPTVDTRHQREALRRLPLVLTQWSKQLQVTWGQALILARSCHVLQVLHPCLMHKMHKSYRLTG